LDKYTAADDGEKRTRHIEKIKNSVKHLNNLLEDFLSMGKLDEGKIGIHLHEFDLAELIRDTIEEMNPALKTNQEVIFTSKGDHAITSDKNLIRNVLFTLLSNAIKFSSPSQPIHVTSVCKKNSTEISVR